ncbi:hypothetical protein [Streptomyces sp. B21-101]|uniref:hypothetical protein n=1 Tax=Streptomyces sp. B21-101 TaxID=3039415 RepID=UPI002FF2BE88
MSTADLVPRQPDATPAAYDAATLAVLAAMEEAAEKHLDAIREALAITQLCG